MRYFMFRKLLYTVTLCLISVGTAFAQTGSLSGTVTDESSGETLPGVNVFIPELERGAATNAQGEFTIDDVEYGTYTIRATYVGYATHEQEVEVDQQTVTLDIAMSTGTEELDDVVVTAYGIERQENELSYSAQNVNSEDLQTGSDNFMEALSGRVSGMEVTSNSGMGSSTDIVLRGANSLTGNNQVLFVVDGVPYANERFNTDEMESGSAGYDFGNTGADINSENIESMTVLKGAAAAALYGSRASNGAIVIETKKGTAGDQPVEVTYNASVGVRTVDASTFPEYQYEYGAGYQSSFLTVANPFSSDPDSIQAVRYNGDGSLGPAFDSSQDVYHWDAFYPDHPNYGQARPWTPPENKPIEFFETGTDVRNSISINGGIADGGYYSMGYNQGNTRGILPNSSLDEYKLNFSAGYEVTDKLSVSGSINYSKTEGVGRPQQGYSTVMSEMRQWWQTNVDITAQKDAYFRNNQNETWNLNSERSGPIYWNNPYWDRYENFASDERDRYVGHAEAEYELLDWLSLTGRVSVDGYNQLIEQRLNVGSVGVPEYQRRTQNFSEYNYDLLANYNKQLTETINIDGVVGMNIRRSSTQGIDAETNGGLVVPGLYSLDNSVDNILYPEETADKLGVNGFFASFNFSYNDYLNFELTGRRDEASSLPEGENVYYYPSASAGFTFSEFIDAEWLSFGKIRGSWAEVGNTAPPFSLRDTYDRLSNFGSAGLYSLPGVQNNSELKPERTKAWETGLQLGFIQDRILLNGTYYDENTVNQIMPVDISTASGYSSRYINAGNVENRGIELSLTGRIISTSDFNWSMTANWNKNISEVKALTEGVDYFEFVAPQGGVSIGAEVGEAFGTIRGSDFIYHENGEPIVEDDGLYAQTSTANEVIGNMNPDWRGGINNEVSYRNVSLSFLVDVRWGGDVFSLDQWYGQGTGLYPITAGNNHLGNPKRDPAYTYNDDGDRTGLVPEEDRGGVLLPGVNEDGSENDAYAEGTGAYGYGINPNAAYIYDASYVKLREVDITYNLPQNLIADIGVIRGASFSVTGRNLWIIHKNLPHGDPEQTIGDANLSGYQGGNLPATRNVTFNLQLNF